MVTMVVTEGVSGLWHYHISDINKVHRGLCDARTMRTSIPVEAWKLPFGDHFPKKPTWCKDCDEQLNKLRLNETR